MTPEALEALILARQPDKLAEALSPLSERDRRSLSKTASGIYRRVWNGEIQSPRRGALASLMGGMTKIGDGWERLHAGASLAVLGVCPLSQAKRLGWLGTDRYQDAFLRVIEDRRSDWLQEWLEHLLAQEWPGVSWDAVSALVKRGICERPRSDGYIRLMANGMGLPYSRNREPMRPLSERLLEDPGLLTEEVWRLFECEHHGFSFDWVKAGDNMPEGYESWPDALIKLMQDGRLDRERLLDASLQALWVSSNSNVLGGFHAFHWRLESTTEEIAARQSGYLELLGHKTPHVVGFTLKMLKTLTAQGLLDGKAFVRAVPPVFNLRPKSHPMAALRLLRRILVDHVVAADAAALLLVDGLRHPAADVQTLAMTLLESLADALEEGTRRQLAGLMDEVAALVQPRLRALLGAHPGTPEGEPEVVDDQEPARAAALGAAVDHLDADTAKSVGLAGLDPDALSRTLPPPLEFDLLNARPLSTADPIEPIESVDELIDAVAHAIEVVDSADEIERIIDGISRLGGQRPADFNERTAPLLRRMRQGQGSATREGLMGWGVPPALPGLVMTWIRGSAAHTPAGPWLSRRGPARFIDARLRELTRRVGAGRAAPLLSAPTHANGWIEPAALVRRLRDHQARGLKPMETDLVQALLRLAPEERGRALAEAAELGGVVGRVVRFALGGEDRPRNDDAGQDPPWVAAGRARDPRGDLSAPLAALGLSLDWPDVVIPVRYRWKATAQTHNRYGQEARTPAVAVETSPSLQGILATTEDEDYRSLSMLTGLWLPRPLRPGMGTLARRTFSAVKRRLTKVAARFVAQLKSGRVDPAVAFPTVLFHQPGGNRWRTLGVQTPWLIDWSATVWPLNADGFFMRGVDSLMQRIDMNTSIEEPNHPYLNPLFEPDRPWTEPAILVLWIGLVSKDNDVRRLAIDALIEGIQDGRAHPEPLAGVLDRLAEDGWLKLNRLAEGLGETARVSTLHQLIVAQTMERVLAGMEALPRNAHLLLELLNELETSLDRGPPEALRAKLQEVRGSGKAAKLTKVLLGRTGGVASPAAREAVLEAIRIRLERAERWHP